MDFNHVNKILKLENTPDWGIINADPNRISEFIEFLKQNLDLDKCIKFEFVELIIASMNEAILQQLDSKDIVTLFFDYINLIKKDDHYTVSIDYWKSLESNEFPVSKLLHTIL